MKPVFVLFNITTDILYGGIVDLVNNNMNTEILVNGIMKNVYDDDQFGTLIVRFDTDDDFEAFLIAWKLANSYELRYFFCRGTPEKIYETFHVEELNE